MATWSERDRPLMHDEKKNLLYRTHKRMDGEEYKIGFRDGLNAALRALHDSQKLPSYFRGDYSKYPSAPCENAVCVPLTKGKHALVDAEDWHLVAPYLWHLGGDGYAVSNIGPSIKGEERRKITMQSLFTEGMMDHINVVKYDNRKSNLRPCTHAQNMDNRPKQNINASSKYKGVTKVKTKWAAVIRHRGKSYHLGLFNDEMVAACVYDMKAMELKGEFAHTNFPKERYAMGEMQ